MIKGKWRRKSWDRQWCLKKLIRETAEQIRRAQCDGDKNTEKKMKRHQYWLFRYAEAIGFHKYEVKVVGKFEYTATVCAFDDSDAMNDAMSEPFELIYGLGRRETSVKRIKELDFKTDEVLSDEKVRL